MRRFCLFTILRYVLVSFEIFMLCNLELPYDYIAYASSNFEMKRDDRLPSFEIQANVVKKEAVKKIVYQGQVTLRYDILTEFRADSVIIEFSDEDKFKDIQILGNVYMLRGPIIIRSQQAFSDNFRVYVDFKDSISVIGAGPEIKPGKLRYYFLLDRLEASD